MINRKAKSRDIEDIIKLGFMLVFGIIFIQAIAPQVSQNIVDMITGIGVFLMIVAVIISLILLIIRPRRPR